MTMLKSTLISRGGRSAIFTKLRLETLDGRLLPDANPLNPPADPPPSQSAPDQQTPVTDVAIISLADASGNFPSTYLILEKAGNEYIATFYDAVQNHYYTGTNSADTSLYLEASVQLDALMAQFGAAGNLNTILFASQNLAVIAPPTTLAGNPPEALQGTGPLTPKPPVAPPQPGGFVQVWIIQPPDGVLPGVIRPVWVYDPFYIRPTTPPPIWQIPPIQTLPPGAPLPYNPPGFNPARPTPPRNNPFDPIGPYIPTPGQFRPGGF